MDHRGVRVTENSFDNFKENRSRPLSHLVLDKSVVENVTPCLLNSNTLFEYRFTFVMCTPEVSSMPYPLRSTREKRCHEMENVEERILFPLFNGVTRTLTLSP